MEGMDESKMYQCPKCKKSEQTYLQYLRRLRAYKCMNCGFETKNPGSDALVSDVWQRTLDRRYIDAKCAQWDREGRR